MKKETNQDPLDPLQPSNFSRKVSVVIPTFNHALFISRAVESVWSQGVAGVEVIVLDDGSEDETETVLRALAEQGDVRWFRQEHAGPGAARNRGIRESRGEWIAFLDADDYWLGGKLRAQLEALETNNGDFAYTGTMIVDDLGQTVYTKPALPNHGSVRALIWGNNISTPTVIARRSLLEKTGLFDETLRVGEDWDLWLRLALHGRGQYVQQPLVAVRFSEWDARDYQLASYEAAIPRILSRFFESLRGRNDMAFVLRQQGKVLSHHFSMLAKAHFHHRNLKSFLNYSVRSVASSPWGVRYLLPASISGQVNKEER